MAPRQVKPNTRQVGRQLSQPKDQGRRPQGVNKERPQLSSRRSARLEEIQRPQDQTVSKSRNTEPKRPLPSLTSKTAGKESPQNPSAPLQDKDRKRKRAQQPEDPPVRTPIKRLRKQSRISIANSAFRDTLGQSAADGIVDDKINPIVYPLQREYQGENSKRPQSHDPSVSETQHPERPRVTQAIPNQTEHIDRNSIAHWAATRSWPREFGQDSIAMSDAVPSKRKSDSTHRSERLEKLASNGIFMKTSNLMQRSSELLCDNLLEDKRTPVRYTSFPRDKLRSVLERVQNLNESRIRRDVTPWIVPSAETLFFCGDLNIDYIGDEVDAEWTKCQPMGSTRPKPDYVAGLLLSAFTKDEIQKLENYASPLRPFLFTPNLSFPFLICEVKSGDRGLNEAERQNIHSASIAVRAVIELYKAAFGSSNPERVSELYGKVLVFTVSHDNKRVCLYAHFAALTSQDAKEPEFYREEIAIFSLSAKRGADTSTASDFVRNVYDKFAPEHRQRIKEAVALLPDVGERTNLSFAASELALGEVASQGRSQDIQSQDDSGFKTPSLPASASHKKGMLKHAQIGTLLEQQREHMDRQAERQMEQQREQMEQQREQMEQQRVHFERQMEQQREQMEQLKEQLRQQTEIISSLLKQERR